MESFYIGLSVGFCCRIVALRWLRYPLNSLPLRSIKPIFIIGLGFSAFDLMRRTAIEGNLAKQERRQIAKQFRKDDKNYDI